MNIRPWPKLQELLRQLSKYEFEELTKSIKQHGVIQPILVLKDGRIIDGYHRWKIAGTKTPFKITKLNEADAFALGIILNTARRNMTLEQVKDLNKKKEKLVKLVLKLRKSGKTQQEVAEETGVPQKTISNWEQDISNSQVAKANIPDCRTTVPKKERENIYERSQKGEAQESIAADYGITQPRVSQIITRTDNKKNQKTPELPEGKFNIILADPPWEYDRSVGQGVVAEQYPVMNLKEICKLPINDLAADDCGLFLWATFPKLQEAMEVIKSWGFNYRTAAFVWIKLNPKTKTPFFGIGSYTKSNAEVCLLATKGEPHKFVKDNSISSVILAPREEHSKKPDEVRDKIVQLLGDLPRVELFARQEIEGWKAWGNEVGN